MSQTEYDTAKKRGERAKKLFDFDSATGKTMKDIIKALQKEDLHAADPNKESGKAAFFKACLPAFPLNLFPGADEAERAAFISDLWNTAVASRKAHEQRPCW